MANTNDNNRITYHIADEPQRTTSIVRKIDERKLNKIFDDDLPTDILESIVKRQLPEPSKVRKRLPIKPPKIPRSLKDAVTSLSLLDEPSPNKRIQIFIGYCKFKNYSYNTTQKYYLILKNNGMFGTTTTTDDDGILKTDVPLLKPNKLSFIDNGRVHTRIVSMDDFRSFVKYLHENISQYTSPILIAVYTGLRGSEILQFSTYTLYQLKNRQQPVAIKRKQTVVNVTSKRSNSDASNNNNNKNNILEPIYWRPVYNTRLTLFVDKLIELYFDEYMTFLNDRIDSLLFHLTPKTLGNRLKSLYYNAVGRTSPHGFGIHSCRNMIAMLMAENTNNIIAIQEFLQHKNLKTTRSYIKSDFTFTTTEFNRLTNYELADVRANIVPTNDA